MNKEAFTAKDILDLYLEFEAMQPEKRTLALLQIQHAPWESSPFMLANVKWTRLTAYGVGLSTHRLHDRLHL